MEEEGAREADPLQREGEAPAGEQQTNTTEESAGPQSVTEGQGETQGRQEEGEKEKEEGGEEEGGGEEGGGEEGGREGEGREKESEQQVDQGGENEEGSGERVPTVAQGTEEGGEVGGAATGGVNQEDREREGGGEGEGEGGGAGLQEAGEGGGSNGQQMREGEGEGERDGEGEKVEEVGERGGGQRPGTEQSEVSAASESSQRQKQDKKREKERKRAEKKSKKKAKSSLDGPPSSPPKLKKRTERSEGRSQMAGSKHIEAILLSVFQPFDTDGSGYVDPAVFWEILQSSELNLQLGPEEIASLQEVVTTDRSGMVPYAEFAARASDIIASLYHNQPVSDTHWVDMTTPTGGRVISYNKQTGDSRDLVEEGVDLFADIIQDLFQMTDSAGKGYATREEFTALLQSEQMRPYLTEKDILEMLQYFDAIPSGQASYADFYPLAKELILRVYRVRDTSDSEWCQLSSPRVGLFFFNKYTGETRRGTTAQPGSGQPEIDLLNQAYRQVEEVTFELEQYKQESRELQNQLAQAREEQEVLAAQLDETGHTLDEANSEIRHKEGEMAELRAVITGREQQIEELQSQLADMAQLRGNLQHLEQQLQDAHGTVAARDQSMADRETDISSLQRQSQSIVEKLKAAQGTIDARDSTIAKLQHQLRVEQNKLKSYEERTPALEAKVASLEEGVRRTQQSLDEKTSALSTTRKHLKHARERNMELEKEMDKAGHMQEKLRGAESEIRTLKSFLTSKTAMVERRKKELMETRARLIDLEEKDNRRSIILADVLEKTARQYQQELQMGVAGGSEVTGAPSSPRQQNQYLGDGSGVGRPVSAPSIPLDPPTLTSSPPPPTSSRGHPPKVMKSYTMGKYSSTDGYGRVGKLRRGRESRTVPRLPPIHKSPHHKSSFHVPTHNELKRRQKEQDKKIVDHSELNPHCSCKLCTFNSSAKEEATMDSGLADQMVMAGLTGSQEASLLKHVRTGQRVLVRMKRSEYELEPQKYTGIVKYVGKIDSEFIDNRIYVGLKLDEPVGDTDGLVKGKRYFTCPARHGKVVRLTNVLAVLPSKSMSYKPLQITKRSPYATTSSQKHVRVT